MGALVSAFAIVVFFLPSNIAPLGVTGLAVIVRELTGAPIALVIILANIPIQVLAFRVLQGWKTLLFTLYTIALYSAAIELMQLGLSDVQLTNDAFLSAVVGGVLAGVGGGLIYRAGGTVGGTSTIAKMLRQRFGLPLSAASLFSDTFVVFLAGAVLGWEAALYAIVAVFINRIVSDYVLEGPSDTCTAIIVTDHAEQIIQAVGESLHRGVTAWTARGKNRGREHEVVMISMLRSETHSLKHLVREVDESAFVSILSGQTVFGKGFHSFRSQMPLPLDAVEA